MVTIPLNALSDLPSDLLRDKVVIDTMNYHPARNGAIAALEEDRTTTSLLTAQHFTGSRVAMAFQQHRVDPLDPTPEANR